MVVAVAATWEAVAISAAAGSAEAAMSGASAAVTRVALAGERCTWAVREHGSSLHGGGFGYFGSMPGMSGGLRIGPSLGGLGSSPNFGSLRAPSGLSRSPGFGNSGLGGGTLRVSPNVGGLRSSNLNPGSAIMRSGNGSLSRATVGNVRPNIGTLGPRTNLPEATSRSAIAPHFMNRPIGLTAKSRQCPTYDFASRWFIGPASATFTSAVTNHGRVICKA